MYVYFLKEVTHSDTNPLHGQCLTHAHSHITQAVAAMSIGTGQAVGWYPSVSLAFSFPIDVQFV